MRTAKYLLLVSEINWVPFDSTFKYIVFVSIFKNLLVTHFSEISASFWFLTCYFAQLFLAGKENGTLNIVSYPYRCITFLNNNFFLNTLTFTLILTLKNGGNLMDTVFYSVLGKCINTLDISVRMLKLWEERILACVILGYCWAWPCMQALILAPCPSYALIPWQTTTLSIKGTT